MMMRAWLKIIFLWLTIGFSACTTFYNRQYTRGIYYDLSHHPHKAIQLKSKQTIATAVTSERVKDSLMEKAAANVPVAEPQSIRKKTAISILSGKQLTPVTDKFLNRQRLSVPTFHERKISKSNGLGPDVGKAFLYILAILLAACIIGLAIYFLPSLLIPAAAASAFTTIVLIAAVIVCCLLAFLIYTLIDLLIDLFKPKKVTEDDF